MAGKPIKMRRVESFAKARHVGDFWWRCEEEGARSISALVPASHGDRVATARVGAYGWHWNGDLDRPTLTPSVRVRDALGEWHGWIRDGFLVEA